MSILHSTAAILQLMQRLRRSITTADVIAELGFPKSTASRIMKQLCETGFLEKNTALGTFAPGLMLLEAVWMTQQSTTLAQDVETALRSLSEKTGHTGYISVLDGSDVLVLRVVPGRHALRVLTLPGTRSPAWRTSTGRALLARLDDEQALHCGDDGQLDAMQRSERIARLQRIREQRWSSAVNEAVSATASVSCAVGNPQSGETVSFCLSCPASLIDETDLGELALLLREKAEMIGRKYGDPWWQS